MKYLIIILILLASCNLTSSYIETVIFEEKDHEYYKFLANGKPYMVTSYLWRYGSIIDTKYCGANTYLEADSMARVFELELKKESQVLRNRK